MVKKNDYILRPIASADQAAIGPAAPHVPAVSSSLSAADLAALEALLREYANTPVLGPGRCSSDVLRDAHALVSRLVRARDVVPTVTLSGHQLRDALEFINPDGLADWEQGENELTFGVVSHQADDGTVKVGTCCWNDDTDGVYPLDEAYLRPIAPTEIPFGEGRWVSCTPSLLLAGVSCADTPRRRGENHSHDHWISHSPAPLPLGSALEEQLGRRLLQSAQSVCGMFGRSEAELVNWLTRDGGLLRALEAYHAARMVEAAAQSGGCAMNAAQRSAPAAAPVFADRLGQAPALAGTELLQGEDFAALCRFAECCGDVHSGGHDVSKDRLARLCEIGVLQSKGYGRHQVTSFGAFVLGIRASAAAPLPLKTYAEYDADAMAAAGARFVEATGT